MQEDLERQCPDIMKLGLLHEVGVRKASARKQPAYLSYEHKTLQDFGASTFVTERLETAENIKVNLNICRGFFGQFLLQQLAYADLWNDECPA